MTTSRTTRQLVATTVLALGLSLVACTDEDGDGAVTDEEVDQIDEQLEDLTDEIEEEIDEGTSEADD